MVSDDRKKQLGLLEREIDYQFNDIALLNKALTHKSYVNEKTEPLKHNERLEFLGDSVLDLIVSDFMVKKYGDHKEGALSKIRASVVNETCLAKLARNMGLGKFLLLGKGENLSGGRDKNSLLANTFEAVAGAIYFDSNLESTYRIMLPLMESEIEIFASTCQFRDYKSDLQEYTQNKLDCIPLYRVVGETGPDHDKRFMVMVKIQDLEMGTGSGKSKKEAEQGAAKIALDIYNNKSRPTLTYGG